MLALLGAAPSPEAALGRARELRLWDRVEWRRLGHWKPDWRGRPVGDATSGFFLSEDGRRDPRRELEAMVAGLYAPEPGGGAQHPRCRFPARTAWLVEALGIEPASLPPADCSRYEDWRRLMDLRSVSLVFASSYLSNPSSMFGHTFLLLSRAGTGEDQRLRDNTLNFSAETGGDGGVAFAFKGLTGGYPGKYGAKPYYMKVAEYGAIENRDLWEYRLALSTAEVDRLGAHAWELGPAVFPYYFLSMNCSYQLMPALEAAAPRLSLMPGRPAIVGPADTLLAARGVPGLVPEVAYRPSHATSLLQRRALLSGEERRAARAYAFGDVAEGDRRSEGWPAERKAAVLDAAQDFVLYRRGFSPDVPEAVRELERPILVRRARLPVVTSAPPPPAWAAPPDEGHFRHRLWVGGGARRGGSFTELSWRPGYHGWSDPSRGFLPGAAIEGFPWRLRYDHDERRLNVRDLRVIEILSASPWDPWTHKPAWGAGTGLESAFELGRSPSRSMVYEGHAGTGLAAAPRDGLLGFALLQAEGAVGSALREGWTAGGALRSGVAADLGTVRAVLEGALAGRVLGDRTSPHRLHGTLSWSPRRDRALRVEALLRGPYREAGAYAVLYH